MVLFAAGLAALMTTAAMAEGIGVSMARFDDKFLTELHSGIQAQVDAAGLSAQIEDAQDDVAKQLDQIKNFIASRGGAIIVNPVDTSATEAQSDVAAAASVPQVCVNRQPINVDTLPDNQAFGASGEVDSSSRSTWSVTTARSSSTASQSRSPAPWRRARRESRQCSRRWHWRMALTWRGTSFRGASDQVPRWPVQLA